MNSIDLTNAFIICMGTGIIFASFVVPAYLRHKAQSEEIRERAKYVLSMIKVVLLGVGAVFTFPLWILVFLFTGFSVLDFLSDKI